MAGVYIPQLPSAQPVGTDYMVIDNNSSTSKTTINDAVAASKVISDIKGYIGYNDSDIYGLEVDYAGKSFARLAGAVGRSQGAGFNDIAPWSGRRRCNVADDGTINAYYGDSGYKEDGSNGQVMVYTPKFYYKVVPLVLEPQAVGEGYHLRKARYYISATPKEGFKLHPAFGTSDNPRDYFLVGAYEACLYDTSAAKYITDDAQVADFNADKMSSIAGVKPMSGTTQTLTRANARKLANNRGTGWMQETIQMASATQLLAIIEAGTMNTQTAYGKGVVDYATGAGNEASNTGSTSALGNGSGSASSTTHIASGGTATTDTTVGKLAVSYRGEENFWGNIWQWVDGVNLWGDGSMGGGQVFVADDLAFADDKKAGNYKYAGFTAANANGYISAMGYGSEEYDWLFIASECTGNSSLPVGDYTYIAANMDGYRVAFLGGSWNAGWGAGGFCWDLHAASSYRHRGVGGRLGYAPHK